METSLKSLGLLGKLKKLNLGRQKELNDNSWTFEFDTVGFESLLRSVNDKSYRDDISNSVYMLFDSIGKNNNFLKSGLLSIIATLGKTSEAYITTSYKVFLQELINTIYSTDPSTPNISVGQFSYLIPVDESANNIINFQDYNSKVILDVKCEWKPLLLKQELIILLSKIGFANTVHIFNILRRMIIVQGPNYRFSLDIRASDNKLY